MDPQTQKVFDEIVRKDITGLLPSEKVFLRARRSYLNYEQQQRFAPIIDDIQDAARYEIKEEVKVKSDPLKEYRRVVKRLKELKIAIPKGMKLPELINLLNQEEHA